MNKKEYDFFMQYFNHPDVIYMANTQLGPPLKLTFDWGARKILARGSFQAKEFDMDEMKKDLKFDERSHVSTVDF